MKRTPTRIASLVLPLVMGSTLACAQPAPGGNPAPVNPVAPAGGPAVPAGAPNVDAILDQLDQRGQTLDTFVADVELMEEDATLATENTRVGKLWYQKLPDGSVRLRIAFTDRLTKNAKQNDPIDYVLEGGRLIERQHAKKLEVRRQILKPGEKLNPFKLGEGPVPLPIGQKKEDVKKQFDVTAAKPDKEDPAGTSHVMLRPRANTSLSRKFSLIDVWVDQKSQMPAKIMTADRKEENIKTTTLKNIQINPKLADEDFKLPAIDETKWNVTVETLKE
ncbi:LolA family protein [Humisphaera borealis]|uniref:Outer membrane lipoprotein carrier protein LolA n=1 Tax=Humisphaera borealis TaxID=2807512 RepID=A0A7M2WPR1_9BACT|nr:hypothetical protein [Humisphaera borealis]QOV87403.1 hypothetical protein IPV69_13995 [Humisphaera borealis]